MSYQYTYDQDSNLIKVTGPRTDGDDSIEYEYDGIGRLIKVIDTQGNEQEFEYDDCDRLIKFTRHDNDPLTSSVIDREWIYEYDARGRRVKIKEPNLATTEFEYDDRDHLVSIINDNSVVTEFEYGLMGEQLKQTIDPGALNIINSWTYDAGRRLASYIDPLSQVTTYSYDILGRLFKTIIPGGASFTKTFDSNGRLVENKTASGSLTTFSYDKFGRLETMQGTGVIGITADVPEHTFGYDGLDRIISADITSGPSIARAYDSLGRLISETNHSLEQSISDFDPTDGTFKKNWSDGRIETCTPNLNGIVEKMERTSAGTLGNDTLPILNNLQTHGPNLLADAELWGTSTSLNRKVKVTAAYDANLRIDTLRYFKDPPTHVLFDLEKVVYSYDSLNRRTGEVITNDDSAQLKTLAHSFDNNDRLIETVDGATTHGYTLNEADERETYTIGGSDRDYTYDPGHRILTAGADDAHTYADGPVKDIGSQDYTIDAFGRTIGVDGTFEITFDALGRPAIIDDGITVRKLCYFGEELWQEVIGSTVDRQYSHHPLFYGPVALHVSSNTYAVLTEARLNRLAISNSLGNVVSTDRYRYSSFGVTGSTSGVFEPWFGGMRYLPTVELYLGRHRLMNPEHGMWLGLDPKAYKDSPNLYAYCGQNPIDSVDPKGLNKEGPAESTNPTGFRAEAKSSLSTLGFPNRDLLGFPLDRMRAYGRNRTKLHKKNEDITELEALKWWQRSDEHQKERNRWSEIDKNKAVWNLKTWSADNAPKLSYYDKTTGRIKGYEAEIKIGKARFQRFHPSDIDVMQAMDEAKNILSQKDFGLYVLMDGIRKAFGLRGSRYGYSAQERFNPQARKYEQSLDRHSEFQPQGEMPDTPDGENSPDAIERIKLKIMKEAYMHVYNAIYAKGWDHLSDEEKDRYYKVWYPIANLPDYSSLGLPFGWELP